MPAMNNILSKWVPVVERSRSLALVYSSMYLGSMTGLAFSPLLIHNLGWPSVFYSFGSLGAVWFVKWLNKAHNSAQDDLELSCQEKKLIIERSVSKELVKSIPWRLVLSKPPVCALIASHFCYNWGIFILLTWMPTCYNQVLKFNLIESGLFCVLPWLTMAFSTNLAGWIADTLVSRGLSVTVVRKCEMTGVVVDVGDGATHIVHVADGYVIRSSIKSIPVSGKDVTLFVQQLLKERGENIPPEDSFEVAHKVKEMYYYTCSDIVKEYNKHDKEPSKYVKQWTDTKPRTGAPYTCDIGYEHFMGPEIFFNPEIYNSDFSTPLPTVIDKCIQSAPIDTRRALYKVVN